MTRPETLVRQLVSAVITPLDRELRELRSKAFPAPPVTPEVRRLWRRHQTLRRAAAKTEAALKAAGARTYTSNRQPQMEQDGSIREALSAGLRTRIQRATELRDAAMLAVLGLGAAEARPIVLKLKRDLEKLGKPGR